MTLNVIMQIACSKPVSLLWQRWSIIFIRFNVKMFDIRCLMLDVRCLSIGGEGNSWVLGCILEQSISVWMNWFGCSGLTVLLYCSGLCVEFPFRDSARESRGASPPPPTKHTALAAPPPTWFLFSRFDSVSDAYNILKQGQEKLDLPDHFQSLIQSLFHITNLKMAREWKQENLTEERNHSIRETWPGYCYYY